MNASTSTKKKSSGFTDEEKAAVRARAKELKEEARLANDREAGEKAVLAAIAVLKGSDRTIAERLHAIIKDCAPTLMPKTWYGFPAYARDGKIVCFFQYAAKFNARYGVLGFNDSAHLDEGNMWPASYALTAITATEEAKIRALLKKALS
jgi:uncharacterized protein YdhG (YjbR/CyaY superfamily)